MSTEQTATVEDRVKAVIDKIRPYIQLDGGDIEYVALEDKTVKVRLCGACRGCPGAIMTLKMGVEQEIRKVVPEVESVEAV